MGSTLHLRVPAPVTDEQARRLCAGLQEQLSQGGVVAVVCRVDLPAEDLTTVDAVARLALVARRAGVAFVLDRPGADLCSLLRLVGLRDLAGLPDEP